MNPKFKLGAYVVLLILAAWFGLAFRYNYDAATNEQDIDATDIPSVGATPPAGTNTAVAAQPLTNGSTNVTAQTTNALSDATNAPADITNVIGEATNSLTNTSQPGTNIAAAGTADQKANKHHAGKHIPGDKSSAKREMVGYLGGFIAAVVALGLLIASDVTQYFGGQATDYLLMDVGDEAMRNPLYERAEAEWANAQFLEAIQTLREYLKKNPREMHAALRIAEIYEKDIKNPLAAALEYEEVLKTKLPSERWGWAAIHLCNLYSRLNHHDKTKDLLHRIVNEYPRTAAAKKARVRLGIAELEKEPADTNEPADSNESAQRAAAPVREARHDQEEPPKPEPPASSLPPGFRPKK
jgi:TolA-binding protein